MAMQGVSDEAKKNKAFVYHNLILIMLAIVDHTDAQYVQSLECDAATKFPSHVQQMVCHAKHRGLTCAEVSGGTVEQSPCPDVPGPSSTTFFDSL